MPSAALPAARLSGPAEKWLVEFLLAYPGLWKVRPVVVTGDNDLAGHQGAEATTTVLSNVLGKSVICAFPPPSCKDMRDWTVTGLFKPGWPLNMAKE